MSEKCFEKSFSSKPYKKICPVCNNSFKSSKGKIYCSKLCRDKAKNYPSKIEIEFQYSILKSWEKVAQYFGITRKIIQRISKT